MIVKYSAKSKYIPSELFVIVVRSIKTTDRKGSMRLLRKMGHSLMDSKNLLAEAPFYFYCTDKHTASYLYYNPSIMDYNGCAEYFDDAISLGFNMLTISTFSNDIDEWMNTLTEEEYKDVIFGLDFYIKLFAKYILVPN